MSIFINTENAFDKIKYLLLIKNKTFNKMRINGYFLKMKKMFFSQQKSNSLLNRKILETLMCMLALVTNTM